MSFFGGYSKRGRQLEEQDRKFLEFQRQIREEEMVFEKGDYLAMVLGAFWALWPAPCDYTCCNRGSQSFLLIKDIQ